MSDWIGLAVILGFAAAALLGLRILANPRPRTAEEFERNAAENTTMVGALLNALHDVTDPGAARAKEVRMQMKDGRFTKKKREGKSGGEMGDETGDEETND
jgi:hypothetical protein